MGIINHPWFFLVFYWIFLPGQKDDIIATRHQTRIQKETLKRNLRELCAGGQLLPGHPIPTERELAVEHDLSRTVVTQTLAELIDEGLLYKVPRQGTFVGRPRQEAFEFYLLAMPLGRRDPDLVLPFLQAGFEDRIAYLGGTPLTMALDKVTAHAAKGELPHVAGVFEPFPISRDLTEIAQWNADTGTPRVHFEHAGDANYSADIVSFDNVIGGRQATQHLLGANYRQIAFLGLHTRDLPSSGAAEFWGWSRQRAEGWRLALQEAGLWSNDREAMSFVCAQAPEPGGGDNQIVAAREAARPLVKRLIERRDIEAVVAASDTVAMGLLETLRAADVPSTRWPAIIGFDNLPLASGHVLSSLRLPWEEVGQVAADLLWERRHGLTTGDAQHRSVAMRLIPRLTCRSDWSLSARHSALTASAAPDSLLA